MLPFPHLPVAATINHGILRTTLAALRRKLGMERYQLWSFIPTALPYLGMPGEELAVYYCTDEWSRFSHVDGERIGQMEWELCRRADVVFATARRCGSAGGLQPGDASGVARRGPPALRPGAGRRTAMPDDLADCPRPIVGFFGLVHDWIDISLLAHVAEQRPDWTVAVIGKANVDLSSLQRLPNVKLLGRRPYEELPRYCKAFSVGVMPFALNELTTNVNPIKMREYLSGGLPVVSTDLPEVRGYSEWVRVARSPDEFLAACEEAIADDEPAMRQRRSDAMAGESWEAKVAELGRWVRAVEGRSDGTRRGGAETSPPREAWRDPHRRRRAAELHEGGARPCRLHPGRRRPRDRPHRPALRRRDVEGLLRRPGHARPVIDLGVGSGSHAEQTAAVMVGLERLFLERRPRAVVVVGDVNSTLAAAWSRRSSASPWRTSRPGCASATGRCPRRSTASSPTGRRTCC